MFFTSLYYFNQTRIHILAHPCKLWSAADMKKIITCCIILHNMIIEDEWGEDLENIADSDDYAVEQYSRDGVVSEIEFAQNRVDIMSEDGHFGLRNDLVEHLWRFKHGQTQQQRRR
jgi:hypothetical protein